MIKAADVMREVEERYNRIHPLPKGWEMEPSAAIFIEVIIEHLNREMESKANRFHDHGDPGDE